MRGRTPPGEFAKLCRRVPGIEDAIAYSPDLLRQLIDIAIEAVLLELHRMMMLAEWWIYSRWPFS